MDRYWISIGFLLLLVLTEKFGTTLAGSRHHYKYSGCYGDVAQIDCRKKLIKILAVSVYKTAKCSPFREQEDIQMPALTAHIKATCQSKSNCFVRLVVPATAFLYDLPEDTRCVCMDVKYMCIGGTKSGGHKKKSSKEDFQRSNEYLIKQKLLNDYDKTSRPVKNDNSTVSVNIAMSLFHILDTNEKHQTFSSLVAIRIRWKDEYMMWDPSKYGNVSMVHIPAYTLWLPDLVISNHADDSFNGFLNTYAIVKSNGDVLWMFPAVIKIYCTLNVRHFPFDSQHCDIIFISWTYNGFELNIVYNATVDANAVYYTGDNQEWWVNQITWVRNIKKYACCVEPYPDVTFTIHMNRRSLFYIFNLIFPCMLIYVVCMLGFFLPIESGEKVNLEITILLALVVFLMIIGETLPPTPDAIPLLGMLFGATMLMVSIALIMGVIVTNIHLRKYTKSLVPAFICRRLLRCPCSRNKQGPTNIIGTGSTRKSSTKQRHVDTEVDLSGSFEMESLRPRVRVNGLNKDANSGYIYSLREEEEVQPEPKPQCICKTPDSWGELAKMVDKFFFYSFLMTSMMTFFFIFYQVPSHSVRTGIDVHPDLT